MAGQAGTSGAERKPHGELAAAGRGAGQQQIGQVRAGDQQDQQNGARERVQGGTDVAGEASLQRLGQQGEIVKEAHGGEAGRIVGKKRAGEIGQGLPDLGVVEAGARAGDDAQHADGAGGRAGQLRGTVHEHGPPDLRAPGVIETLGHDADHAVRRAVEREGTGEHGGVSVQPGTPEGIAEDHNLRSLRSLFGFEEGTAEPGPGAEDGEEGGRSLSGVELFGAVSARPVDGEGVEGGGLAEDAFVFAQPVVIRAETDLHRIASEALGHPIDSAGIGKGQRPQQNRIDQAEDGSAGSDGDGQGKRGGDGE